MRTTRATFTFAAFAAAMLIGALGDPSRVRAASPGDDNPGSAVIVLVPEPIPPGGRVQFRYDLPRPLPIRTDGEFETAVKVLSFTEHWNIQPAAVEVWPAAP